MRSSYSVLVQSKFFNPAFNSAIFDGPVRIYFSQFYESLALKLYFAVQESLSEILSQAKEGNRIKDRNILVMLYPNSDAFALSFENHSNFFCSERLDEDFVIGVNGSFEDQQIPALVAAIRSSAEQMLLKDISAAPERGAMAEL
jgi:hypothetical protein